jgi:DNA-binding response OmpR family regulator
MANILIVEDEVAISDLIAMNLELAGYTFTQVFDGHEAVRELEAAAYDLAILDIMLPGLDGFEVLEVAKRLDVPAIFLSAKSDLSDRVAGLKEGADDYLSKPFEAIELLARIEAVLRRKGSLATTIMLGDLVLDIDRHEVLADGNPIDLTVKEYELLLLFAQNRNKALAREVILEKVWGYDFLGESRTVDIHVQRLRKKLGESVHISTVYKFGYRLETKAISEP